MEQLSISMGISYFHGRKAQSLAEWNAQYEAFSIENDWWFKAAIGIAALVRAVRASMFRAGEAGIARAVAAGRPRVRAAAPSGPAAR